MFSGRWEDCLDHDSNGRIFLDFDPYSFQQVLTALRCRPFDLASSVAPPEAIITPDKLHAYTTNTRGGFTRPVTRPLPMVTMQYHGKSSTMVPIGTALVEPW